MDPKQKGMSKDVGSRQSTSSFKRGHAKVRGERGYLILKGGSGAGAGRL